MLLRERERARLDDEQQPAHEGGRAPLAQPRPLGCDFPAPKRPDVEQDAGDEEPDAEHEQRRQGAVGDVDAEVRRSPDDVDDPECGRELHAFSVPARYY